MPPEARAGEVLWRIQAMDCASEENEIRQALSGVSGIAELRFQLASRTLAIRAEPAALSQAETILRRLSYPPQVLEAGIPAPPVANSVPWPRLIASLLLAAAAEGILWRWVPFPWPVCRFMSRDSRPCGRGD
jgi:Cd2+/Zn2+-exporting ATPase